MPHTEIGLVAVNGAEATLDRIVRAGDLVEARGWLATGSPQPVATLDFVADAHLGALARFLRMLGFDTVHDNALSDACIRRLAHDERRVVLTRDRELLKCREILFGAYVRALEPARQLSTIAARFGLAAHARPFSLCLRCNLPLETADEAALLAQLPQTVAGAHEQFFRCRGCARIYWPGSHYERMRAALGEILGAPPA